MFRRLDRLLLVSALTVLTLSKSYASDADDRRAQMAQDQLQIFLADGLELQEKEYFLVSLRTPVFPADLDRLSGQLNMQVKGVNICTARLTIAIGKKPGETIANRVNRFDIRSALGNGPQSENEARLLGQGISSNDLRLCGFEARMASKDLRKLSTERLLDLVAVEIMDGRRRLLPINVIREIF